MMVHTTRPLGAYKVLNPPAFAEASDVAAGVAAGEVRATGGIYNAILVGVAVSVVSHFAIRWLENFYGGRRG